MIGARFLLWGATLVRGLPDALARRDWQWVRWLLGAAILGPPLWLWFSARRAWRVLSGRGPARPDVR